MSKRTHLWGVVTTLVLGGAGAARAQGTSTLASAPDSVPQSRPWAVSAQVRYSTDGPPAYTSVGVNVERVLGRYLRVDADIERGLDYGVPTTDGMLQFGAKVAVGARARATLPFDARQQHAVFLGLGPRFSTSDAYPDLWQGRVEIGYAFRSVGGFSLLYAVGADIALDSQPAPVAPADCVSASCLGPIHPGNANGVARLALGYAF